MIYLRNIYAVNKLFHGYDMMVGGNALHLNLPMSKLTLFVIKVNPSRSDLVIGLLRYFADIDTA